MKKFRVMTVFGTRPEAIKMMPVVKALRSRDCISSISCSTGQHREMLASVLTAFDETVDTDLNLMSTNQTLTELTCRVMMSLASLFTEKRPDLILVHGDTTTAMAASIAAFYCRLPIGHVEAGLRSFDLSRPFPEEFNRVCIDNIADLMFAPTQHAADNLFMEYGRRARIAVTGNTGIDALLGMARRLDKDPDLRARLTAKLPKFAEGSRLILVTGHRRESFGEGFQRICEGLSLISERGDVEIIYPVHLNPNVRGPVMERLGGRENVHLVDPLEYPEMVNLMMRSSLVVTDSGGIQEEGPALGKPVFVMRDVTERPEAVETGVVKLVGTDPHFMYSEISRVLDDRGCYADMARPVFPYGDGSAADRIVDEIVKWFGE